MRYWRLSDCHCSDGPLIPNPSPILLQWSGRREPVPVSGKFVDNRLTCPGERPSSPTLLPQGEKGADRRSVASSWTTGWPAQVSPPHPQPFSHSFAREWEKGADTWSVEKSWLNLHNQPTTPNKSPINSLSLRERARVRGSVHLASEATGSSPRAMAASSRA